MASQNTTKGATREPQFFYVLSTIFSKVDIVKLNFEPLKNFVKDVVKFLQKRMYMWDDRCTEMEILGYYIGRTQTIHRYCLRPINRILKNYDVEMRGSLEAWKHAVSDLYFNLRGYAKGRGWEVEPEKLPVTTPSTTKNDLNLAAGLTALSDQHDIEKTVAQLDEIFDSIEKPNVNKYDK